MRFNTRVKVTEITAEDEGAIATVVDSTDGQGDITLAGEARLQIDAGTGIGVGSDLRITISV